MNLITAENRELALSMSINQRNPHEPDGPHMGVCYLALTFGTLLSSQGADARGTRPVKVVVLGLCCPARRSVPASRSFPAQRESYVAVGPVSNRLGGDARHPSGTLSSRGVHTGRRPRSALRIG